MDIAVVTAIALTAVFTVVGVMIIGFAAGWFPARRPDSPEGRVEVEPSDEVAQRLDLVLDVLRHEQGEVLQSTVETVLSLASSKLGDQMEAGRSVLDRDRETVTRQVEGVQSELGRVATLVAELQKDRAHQAGQLTTGLEQAAKVTTSLADTTRSLERALASPKARGQWGERMAEDVLRAAGFVEGINYEKQTKLVSGGIPDYTFNLPHGHLVHMDVKFPIDNYRRWLDAGNEAERAASVKQFRRDVRQRIKELGDRSYVDPETTVDYVLLFVPNESVYGFLHEHDANLIDEAIATKVVLCSPTTLFAVLAVIRTAVDNFLIERRSDEILGAIGALREQWERLEEPIEKMRRGLGSAQKAFDDLSGTRVRQFSRQLERLEVLRDARAAELDAEDEGFEASSPATGPATLRQVV